MPPSSHVPHPVSDEPGASLLAHLAAQGAAPSHLPRLSALRSLCERTPHCLALALVGSFAQGTGDRVSDLDLAAFVSDDREEEFFGFAHAILAGDELLDCYTLARPGQVALGKYVYLDFASCEFHAFNQRAPFKLRRPYLAVWNPHGFLASLEVDEPPPRHETFTPYPHGDAGLIWELVDCIKWLRRGRKTLATGYLVQLGAALARKDSGRP